MVMVMVMMMAMAMVIVMVMVMGVFLLFLFNSLILTYISLFTRTMSLRTHSSRAP